MDQAALRMTVSRDTLAAAYQECRRELLAYLTRLVVRPDVAEELLQQAALRFLEAPAPPTDRAAARPWLFRVATNLAIDYLRRQSTWRETLLEDTRDRAERDAAFIAESRLLAGSPDMRAIAVEHLSVCFSCTLRNTPPPQAAALLLVEVHGFTVREVAEMLGATTAQAKHWIQAARSTMRDKYAATCALINKQGVCYQCVELSEFFNGRGEDPLAGSARDMSARLAIVRDRRDSALGPWHKLMMRLVDDILGA